MKITIVGTGYVGLVTGTCLSDIGHTVACVDIDEKKIARLSDGKSHIFEPGLETIIKRNVGENRLSFTTDISSCLNDSEMTFIAVGTPEGEDGSADLSYVKAVANEIATIANRSQVVVIKSTVPVGTCKIVENLMSEKLSELGKKDISLPVASNPEFLKEGAAVDDFMRPDRIVVGIEDQKLEKIFRDVYGPFAQNNPNKLLFMNRKSSEMTKYASNAMLATRISFMNELSRLAETVGADIDQIRNGMGLDQRIGRHFLYAGPGYGGSCFPKDVEALIKTADQNEINLSVLKSVSSANKEQTKYVTQKILNHFGNDLAGKRVCIWGLSFKPKTDDVRETPAAKIIESLLKANATVCAHDPEAKDSFKRGFPDLDISIVDDYYSAAENADALVLVTEWSQYKRPEWDRLSKIMRSKAVFDFRNQYDAEKLREIGFSYSCIGRTPKPKS